MPVKYAMGNSSSKEFERGFFRNALRHFSCRDSGPGRPLNALTVRETAYLDHVARVIRRHS